MALIFNNEIGYNGQDIHVCRNGKEFPFRLFFTSTTGVFLEFTYNIALRDPDDPSQPQNIKQYENIIFDVDNNTLIADAYIENDDEPKVTNFIVEVEGTYYVPGEDGPEERIETIKILVHIHDQLEDVWLSPGHISIRAGMAVKYGILAKFTDGNYADVSFYPDFSQQVGTELDGILFSTGYDIRKLPGSPDYTTPTPFPDACTVYVSEYFTGTSQQVELKGSITIFSNSGTLRLHHGDAGQIADRMNILCLSDGFNNSASSGADLKSFQNIVNNFQKQLLRSESYAPWFLFKDKINLWSYYTEGLDDVGTLDDPYIIIDNDKAACNFYEFLNYFDYLLHVMRTGSTQTLADFVKENSDKYGEDFINFIEIAQQGFSGIPISEFNTVGDFVNLTTLYDTVGLPSLLDSGQTD